MTKNVSFINPSQPSAMFELLAMMSCQNHFPY